MREILVRNGQKVRAGEPLLVDRRRAHRCRARACCRNSCAPSACASARATAEAALLPTLDVAGRSHRDPPSTLAREQRVVRPHDGARSTSRSPPCSRRSREAQRACRRTAERRSRRPSIGASSRREETANSTSSCARQGFVQRTRLLALERAEADYRSRSARTAATSRAARQRIGELQARIAQTRNQYQQQATDELKEAVARIRELEERLRPSQDQAERQIVRSPVDGEVMALRVARRATWSARAIRCSTSCQRNEKLVVEAAHPSARHQPRAHGRCGRSAPGAFDSRTTPLLPGKVVFVSPDRVTNPDGTVLVRRARSRSTPRRCSAIRSCVCRPACRRKLFVTTPPRTLFEYLVEAAGPVRAAARCASPEALPTLSS